MNSHPKKRRLWLLQLTLFALIVLGTGCPEPDIPCTPSAPKANRFSILTYNVHLFDISHVVSSSGLLKIFLGDLVDSYLHQTGSRAVDYLDHRRNAELAKRLLDLPADPDVVVLNEMWSDKLAYQLSSWVGCRYPYRYRPDAREDLFNGEVLGSGLMLLSKYPIVPSSIQFTRFNRLSNEDTLAVKGFGEATLQVGNNQALSLFFTHADAGQSSETFDNLRQINEAIDKQLVATPTQAIVVAGDLNVSGDTPNYNSMMDQFGAMKDAYRIQNPDKTISPGYTIRASQNELWYKFASLEYQARLDYILINDNSLLKRVDKALSGDPSDIPQDPWLQNHFYFIDPTNQERLPLSDHFPLLVEFELTP